MSRLAVIGYPQETKREFVAAWCASGSKTSCSLPPTRSTELTADAVGG